MGRFEDFRQYAVDCVRQAEGEPTPEERNILLNMALAWVRLAQQSQVAAGLEPADPSGLLAAPPTAPDATAPPAG